MLIPTDILAAAAICAGRDDTRYYLNGVCLDERGYVASTDGHRAFFGKLTDTPLAESLVVPLDIVTRAVKAARKAPVVEYLKEDGKDWILAGTERIFFEPIDGVFPDWIRVIPTSDDLHEETPAKFNPRLYGDIGKMAKILVGDDIAFHIFQKTVGPAGITFGAREDCGAAFLPIGRNDQARWIGRPYVR